MEELVSQISERAGISEAQARQAVEMVVGFAQTRLPAPFGAQLEALLGDGSATPGVSSDITGHLNKLGGLFGSRE